MWMHVPMFKNYSLGIYYTNMVLSDIMENSYAQNSKMLIALNKFWIILLHT